VVLRDFAIRGNSLFTGEELVSVLKPSAGQALDMAGLRALTDLVSGYYADRGYPFVRVYLPEQDLGSGVLQMIVVEGRYGAIRIEPAQNVPSALEFPRSVVPAIESFLSDIQVGDFIQAKTLERGTLLLEDQPGVKVTPIIQPGQAPGTGDLMVRYQRAQPFLGEMGIDNHGSRFTGDLRVKADLTWNSPFAFGDQVRVSAMRTSQNLTLGSLAYSGLINGDGWRWRASLAYTDYTLGKDYASLLRSGVARIRSVGVSYPFLRSQAANLTFTATAQSKRFLDSDGINLTQESKSAESVPVGVQFDFRDQILGGGINYGYATFTRGAIQLYGAALDTDQSGARTDGHFAKREVDFSRLQMPRKACRSAGPRACEPTRWARPRVTRGGSCRWNCATRRLITAPTRSWIMRA
jgi:hemolysin activation/secretion protein